MADKPTAEPIYRVIFNNQSEVYELYALYIYQSEMYGFVEVEELLFDEEQFGETQVEAGDKAEVARSNFAKFKQEFSGVKRSFIPLQSIIRIDEMEKPGVVKVSAAKDNPAGNIRHFPSTGFKRPTADPVETPEDSSTPPTED